MGSPRGIVLMFIHFYQLTDVLFAKLSVSESNVLTYHEAYKNLRAQEKSVISD